MFCRNCGIELNEGAKFCAKCGNAVSDGGQAVQALQTKAIEDNNIKYSLKPTFKLMYKLIGNLFTSIAIILVIYFGIFEGDLELFFDSSIIWVIAIGFITFYTLIKTILDSLQYNELEYNFYNTKIEYKDGFINKEEKELKYKYIREVTMSRSILERMFGIGTVNIFTNASSGGSGDSHGNMNGRNGIHIHCLENVEEEYRKIKQIIDEGIDE